MTFVQTAWVSWQTYYQAVKLVLICPWASLGCCRVCWGEWPKQPAPETGNWQWSMPTSGWFSQQLVEGSQSNLVGLTSNLRLLICYKFSKVAQLTDEILPVVVLSELTTVYSLYSMGCRGFLLKDVGLWYILPYCSYWLEQSEVK